jgi:YD repeat-containing protein
VRLNHPVSGPLTAGYVHDANGNLTQQCEGGSVTRTSSNCTGTTILSLQYDALDRLAQADKTGLPSETYGYDDQGRRIHKTVGANCTDYLYMGPDGLRPARSPSAFIRNRRSLAGLSRG